MAVDDVSAEEIIECGTIEVMMEIVAKNPGNEKVLRRTLLKPQPPLAW